MLRGCGCHGSGGRGLIGRLLAYKQVIGGMVEKMPENKKIGSGVGVGVMPWPLVAWRRRSWFGCKDLGSALGSRKEHLASG